MKERTIDKNIGIIIVFVLIGTTLSIPLTSVNIVAKQGWIDPPPLTSPGKDSPPGGMIDTLTPEFTWQAVPGVDYYGLYVSKYPYGSNYLVYQTEAIPGDSTSFVIPAGYLEKGVMYRWSMASHSSAGWSYERTDGGEKFSDSLYFTTGVNGIDVHWGKGRIKWAKVYDAGYRFAFIKATQGGDNTIILLPKGCEGTILDHNLYPIKNGVKNCFKASGYCWWYVKFIIDNQEHTGWIAENGLEEVEPDGKFEVGEKVKTRINGHRLRNTPEITHKFPDPEFTANMDKAHVVGTEEGPFLVGAYHFAEPNLALSGKELLLDAENEANYLREIAGDYFKGSYLRPALDVEDPPEDAQWKEHKRQWGVHCYNPDTGEIIWGIDKVEKELGKEVTRKRLSKWIYKWMRTVITEAHVEPILYVTTGYTQTYLEEYLNAYDLWIANVNPVSSPETGVWNTWAFWQYSWEGSVPGIEGNVDLDIFNGDMDKLRNFMISPLKVDVVLLIDRSGSMYGSKINDAKWAAKFFVDLMEVGDQVGVVSYASTVNVDYPLSEIESPDTKTAVKSEINEIYASGMTAMGDGLRTAYNQLVSNGNPSHPWAIILMSNGWHNWGSEDPYDVLPDLKSKEIKVYTIGLGEGAAEDLLRHIAAETNGFYRFAANSFNLLEIYFDLAGKITLRQLITSIIGFITQGTTKIFDVSIDSSIDEVTYSVTWEHTDLDLTLIQPDGKIINPTVAATDPDIEYTEEERYEIYRINNPMPGTWQMVVEAIDVPPEGETFFLQVTARTTVTLNLETDKNNYTYPEPVKITATLQDTGDPLVDADVKAIVTRPDNSQIKLILFDDGLDIHGDTAPNDGIYTNYFTEFNENGSYTIKAVATGKTLIGENFSREDKKTVSVYGVPLDDIPPQTIKTVGDPKYGVNDTWVTSYTLFNLTAEDNPGGTGVDKTYYRIWYKGIWNPEPGTGVGINNNFTVYSGNFTLSGECKHYLEYYSTDKAGNIEMVHNQTHYVDDTPPTSNITISQPKFNWTKYLLTQIIHNIPPEIKDIYLTLPVFVTNHTHFQLKAKDQGKCQVGVGAIFYRTWNTFDGWTKWKRYEEKQEPVDAAKPGFTLDKEGPNHIEYYSQDLLQNREKPANNQSCLVDDTPPQTQAFGYNPIILRTTEHGGKYIPKDPAETNIPREFPPVGPFYIHYRYKIGENQEWTEWFTSELQYFTGYITITHHSILDPVYVDYYATDILGNKEETHHDVFEPETHPFHLELLSPENRANNLDINTNLRWSSNAQSYDVYFGKTTPPALLASGWTKTFYNPGLLDYGATYYWKIVVHSRDGQKKESPVWYFTTTKGNTGDSNPNQNQPPFADFTFTPTSPQTGEEVFFQDKSTDPDGNIVSWHWDFGDGTTSDEKNPKHVYITPGVYLVTLTVEDDDGAENMVYNSLIIIDQQGDNQNTTPLSIRIVKPGKALYFNNKRMLTLHTPLIVGNINIEAQVSDKTRVEKVEFYVDNQLRATDTTAPYTWVWSEKTFGRHTIKVIAYNKTGYTATDKTVVTKIL